MILLVLVLGYILPNTEVLQHILYKLTCCVLGITVNVKNPKQREEVEVYVSNCVSNFDHLAVHGVTRAVMVIFYKHNNDKVPMRHIFFS